jgi:hypothetical protein
VWVFLLFGLQCHAAKLAPIDAQDLPLIVTGMKDRITEGLHRLERLDNQDLDKARRTQGFMDMLSTLMSKECNAVCPGTDDVVMEIVEIVIFSGFEVTKIVKDLADSVCPMVPTIRCAVAANECGMTTMIQEEAMNGTNMTAEQVATMQHVLDGLATALACVCECPDFLNLTKTLINPDTDDQWGTACGFIPNLMPCFNTQPACRQTEDMARMLFEDLDLNMLLLNCMADDVDCTMSGGKWSIPRKKNKRTALQNCSYQAFQGELASYPHVDKCCHLMQADVENKTIVCSTVQFAADRDWGKQFIDLCPNYTLPSQEKVNEIHCEADRVMKATAPLTGQSPCFEEKSWATALMAPEADAADATSTAADVAVLYRGTLAVSLMAVTLALELL